MNHLHKGTSSLIFENQHWGGAEKSERQALEMKVGLALGMGKLSSLEVR